MHAFLPEGFSALSSIVRNWTFSLFYLMSELWGSVVVSVLVSGHFFSKGSHGKDNTSRSVILCRTFTGFVLHMCQR